MGKRKKLSIKSVIDRELDKEEKEGRLKVRPVKKKKASQDKTKSKKVLKERQEGFEKDLKKRPEIKKVIELSEGITIKNYQKR